VLDWTNSRLEANITGKKNFGKLSIKDLVNVSTINDINIADFIILSRHEVVNEEITFEDLEVDGTLLVRFHQNGLSNCLYKHIKSTICIDCSKIMITLRSYAVQIVELLDTRIRKSTRISRL